MINDANSSRKKKRNFYPKETYIKEGDLKDTT